MNGAGSSVLPQQKTCGVDEERAFKQSLKLLDSQTRRFILIKLHFFTSLFVVTGLLSCTAVAVWLISGSLFQLLPEEEATTSAMFECGHYNGSVSGVLHGKNISGPCQEDRRHEWCTYVWLRYSSKTWSMLSLWHSVQFVCFVTLNLCRLQSFALQSFDTVSKESLNSNNIFFPLTFLPCAILHPKPQPYYSIKKNIYHAFATDWSCDWVKSKDIDSRGQETFAVK